MSYLELINNLQGSRLQKKTTKKEKHIDGSLDYLKRWGASVVENTFSVASDNTLINESTVDGKTLLDNDYDSSIWESPDRFLHLIQRDLNILEESSDPRVRRSCIKKIHNLIVNNKDSVSSFIADNVFLTIRRPLLKAFSDEIDEIREHSANIVSVFTSAVTDVEDHMRLIFPVLISRLGISGMDGLVYLPEDALNKESVQLPQEIRPVEESEEVRLEFYKTAWTAIERFDLDLAVAFADEAAGLLRAACMDPHSTIKEFGCNCLVEFIHRFDKVMYHFSVNLVRGVSSCLVHNHARVRIKGLDVVTSAMKAGMYKYSAFIIEHMVGYYDPNVVPIKAFYEYHTQMNYFARLTHDRSHAVRRHVHETIALWLATHGDRMDYEGKVTPYLLSGLFDEVPASQWYAMALLERVGQTYGEQQEKDLRELRQFAVASPWTYNNKARFPFPLGARLRLPENPLLYSSPGASEDQADSTSSATPLAASIKQYSVERYCSLLANGTSIASEGFISNLQGIELSPIQKELFGDNFNPLKLVKLENELFANCSDNDAKGCHIAGLPSLEVRVFVRSVARRFIKALLHEVTEFKELTTTVSANLLMVLLPFVEENATEYLDGSIALTLKVLNPSRNAPVASKKLYSDVLRSLGALTLPRAWWKIVKSHLIDGVSEDSKWTSLLVLSRLLSGSTAILRDVRYRHPGIESLLKPILSDLVTTLSNVAPDILVAPPYATVWMHACLAELAQPEIAKDLTFEDVGRLVATTLCIAAGSYVPTLNQNAVGNITDGAVVPIVSACHVADLIDHWAFFGPQEKVCEDTEKRINNTDEIWSSHAEKLVSRSISAALHNESGDQLTPGLVAALLKVAPLQVLSECKQDLVKAVSHFCTPMNPPSTRAVIRSAASEILYRTSKLAESSMLIQDLCLLENIRQLATNVAVAALVPPLNRSSATADIVSSVKVWYSRQYDADLASHLLSSGAAISLADLCAAHELPQKLFWLQVVEYWQKTTIPHQAELAENELDIPSAARAKIRKISFNKAAEARTGAALALNKMLLAVRAQEAVDGISFALKACNMDKNKATTLLKKIWTSLRRVLQSPERAREILEAPLEEQLKDLCVASAANPVHFQADDVEFQGPNEKICEVTENKLNGNEMVQELNDRDASRSEEIMRKARVADSIKLLKQVMQIEKRELRQRSMPFRRCSAETLIVVVSTLRLFFLPQISSPFPRIDSMALVRLSSLCGISSSTVVKALTSPSHPVTKSTELWYKQAGLTDNDLTRIVEQLLDHFMELDPPSLPPQFESSSTVLIPDSNSDFLSNEYDEFIGLMGHYSVSSSTRHAAGTDLLARSSDSSADSSFISYVKETALYEIYKLLLDICMLHPSIFMTRQQVWEREGRVKRSKVYSDLLVRVSAKK